LTDSEELAKVVQNGSSPLGQPSAVGAPRSELAGERASHGSGGTVGCQQCGDPRAIYVRYREEKLGAYLCVVCGKEEIRIRVGTNE